MSKSEFSFTITVQQSRNVEWKKHGLELNISDRDKDTVLVLVPKGWTRRNFCGREWRYYDLSNHCRIVCYYDVYTKKDVYDIISEGDVRFKETVIENAAKRNEFNHFLREMVEC
jgi:hypothetical protein